MVSHLGNPISKAFLQHQRAVEISETQPKFANKAELNTAL